MSGVRHARERVANLCRRSDEVPGSPTWLRKGTIPRRDATRQPGTRPVSDTRTRACRKRANCPIDRATLRCRAYLGNVGYPLRDEIEGAYYHLGTRGNNQRDIYSDDASRLLFLLMLQTLAKKYAWRILAYCLMNNHYHLALRLGPYGLSRGMQALNGGYALTFNAREGRRDHLFGRRFWSRELVDADEVVTTCAYIERNPTRSFGYGPSDWPWSGYNAAAGLEAPKGFHKVGDLWQLLEPRPRDAMDAYVALVAAGL
jgi:REP element-mobilizing transposase RayT